MSKTRTIFAILIAIVSLAFIYSVSAQSGAIIKGAKSSNQVGRKQFSQSGKSMKKLQTVSNKKRRKHLKKKTTPDNQPQLSEAKRGGTFNGDLRDIPQTKPVQVERPKLEQPKTKPRVYVPPTVKPQ